VSKNEVIKGISYKTNEPYKSNSYKKFNEQDGGIFSRLKK